VICLNTEPQYDKHCFILTPVPQVICYLFSTEANSEVHGLPALSEPQLDYKHFSFSVTRKNTVWLAVFTNSPLEVLISANL
jgi:hypothetical protein